MLKYITYESRDEVLILTINRPECLNALSNAVFNELEQFFNFHIEDSTKGVIIKGAGDKAFVAGADIAEFEGKSAQAMMNKANYGKQVFQMIEDSVVPTIALIGGYALGGGLELALSCHMRFATVNASFGCPEINLGILPGWGATARLPKVVGKAKALELILTGDRIDAEEAKSIGLINGVMDEEVIEGQLVDILTTMNAKSKYAVRSIVSAVRSEGAMESTYFGELSNRKAFIENVAKFLKK